MMRIVTFNVQHGRSVAGPVDNDLLARCCAGLGADVLGLQEVDVGVRRSGGVDQAALVAGETGLTAVFGRASRVGWRGSYGNALLVRGAVWDVEVLPLPRLGRRERRAAILARVAVGGRDVSVAVTHLSVDDVESTIQLDALVAALSRRPLPRVLLGDLNRAAVACSAVLEAAGMCLCDPSQPTFPAAAPRARIDHVAVAGLPVRSVEVLSRQPVSDHRPLAVDLV